MKNEINKIFGFSKDLTNRRLEKDDHIIDVIFFETLCNSTIIEKFIINPIIEFNGDIDNVITGTSFKSINSVNDSIKELLNGSTIVIIDNSKLVSIETKENLDRSISESSNEGTIVGPRDAFIENFNTNVGLIRKRIKNNNLFLENIILGSESNTKIGIIYMNNLVNKELLKRVRKKIESIKNDIIIDGSYIKEQLTSRYLFPNVNQTERPDLVSYALLEGKICIVTDNSPNVLIIPTFFIDFFHTPEDYYQKNINTTFIRILKFIAFLIAIFLPGIYIAITTHNPTSLPTSLILKIIEQHKSVPFPAFFEILIMTLAFEILRESDIRSPSKVGSSSSILGGLILGEAAVEAGIISPIMIIIVAASSISSFVFPYNSIVNQIRYYRLLNLLLGALFGLFGIFVGLSILIINISSIDSFGYPYTFPFVPLIKRDLLDSFIKVDTDKKMRNPLLTKEMKRI